MFILLFINNHNLENNHNLQEVKAIPKMPGIAVQ
jgi:hypothetical protein